MFRLSEAVASNVASPQGWLRPEVELARALGVGMAPAEIAALLGKSLRGGQPDRFLFEREAGLAHLLR